MNDFNSRGERQLRNARTTGNHKTLDATEVPLGCKDEESFGIYVHIPFCKHLCPYCDFAVHTSTRREDFEKYVQALIQEIRFHAELGWKRGRKVRTLFLGGGTPSLIPLELLENVLLELKERFEVSSTIEITLEINPETVTLENARAWKEMGINRGSVGVQSTTPKDLNRLERTHSTVEAQKAVETLRLAGFENVSVDLMFGLEDQTLNDWKEVLKTVLSWKPDHISAYNLTIEDRTRFAVEDRRGTLKRPNDDVQVEMLLATRSILSEAGLPPYEISNFAKLGKESVHNIGYWIGKPYWGVGISAHSFQRIEAGFERAWNVRTVKPYVEALSKKTLPTRESEVISKEKHLGERFMTGLRMTEGIEVKNILQDLNVKMPTSIQQATERFIKTGHIQTQGQRLALTEKGILISDLLFRDLQP